MSLTRLYDAMNAFNEISANEKQLLTEFLEATRLPTIANARIQETAAEEASLSAEDKSILEAGNLILLSNKFNAALQSISVNNQKSMRQIASKLTESFNALDALIQETTRQAYAQTKQVVGDDALAQALDANLQHESYENLNRLHQFLDQISDYAGIGQDGFNVSTLYVVAKAVSEDKLKEVAVNELRSEVQKYSNYLALKVFDQIPLSQMKEFFAEKFLSHHPDGNDEQKVIFIKETIKQFSNDEKVKFVKDEYLKSFYVKVSEKKKSDELGNLLACGKMEKLLAQPEPAQVKITSFQAEFTKEMKRIKGDVKTSKFFDKVESIFKKIKQAFKHMAERPKYFADRLFKQHGKKTYAEIPTVDATNSTRHRP